MSLHYPIYASHPIPTRSQVTLVSHTLPNPQGNNSQSKVKGLIRVPLLPPPTSTTPLTELILYILYAVCRGI